MRTMRYAKPARSDHLNYIHTSRIKGLVMFTVRIDVIVPGIIPVMPTCVESSDAAPNTITILFAVSARS